MPLVLSDELGDRRRFFPLRDCASAATVSVRHNTARHPGFPPRRAAGGRPHLAVRSTAAAKLEHVVRRILCAIAAGSAVNVRSSVRTTATVRNGAARGGAAEGGGTGRPSQARRGPPSPPGLYGQRHRASYGRARRPSGRPPPPPADINVRRREPEPTGHADSLPPPDRRRSDTRTGPSGSRRCQPGRPGVLPLRCTPSLLSPRGRRARVVGADTMTGHQRVADPRTWVAEPDQCRTPVEAPPRISDRRVRA